eukprot:13750566-Alexandrium_andersonii.AAC.1
MSALVGIDGSEDRHLDELGEMAVRCAPVHWQPRSAALAAHMRAAKKQRQMSRNLAAVEVELSDTSQAGSL